MQQPQTVTSINYLHLCFFLPDKFVRNSKQPFSAVFLSPPNTHTLPATIILPLVPIFCLPLNLVPCSTSPPYPTPTSTPHIHQQGRMPQNFVNLSGERVDLGELLTSAVHEQELWRVKKVRRKASVCGGWGLGRFGEEEDKVMVGGRCACSCGCR